MYKLDMTSKQRKLEGVYGCSVMLFARPPAMLKSYLR